MTLPGCRALEGLHLRMDSRTKRLVASELVIAATAVRFPCFGTMAGPACGGAKRSMGGGGEGPREVT